MCSHPSVGNSSTEGRVKGNARNEQTTRKGIFSTSLLPRKVKNPQGRYGAVYGVNIRTGVTSPKRAKSLHLVPAMAEVSSQINIVRLDALQGEEALSCRLGHSAEWCQGERRHRGR